MNTTTAPRWVQVLIGFGLAAIAASALKVDITNNYEYGASVSHELATVMVLAAVCVGALPAMAGIFGWSPLIRALTVVCLAFTCWAAVNAYAQKMGEEILSKTSQAAHYAAAEKDQAAARATLARIKETADTATLERLIADAKATADAAELGDTKKMGSPSCFKPCREAKATHLALLDRLAEAKARDAAKAELAKAKNDAKTGPAEASMVATWIASWTGRDATDIAKTIALVMTVLGIAVTQGLALLAHPAANLIGTGFKGAGKPCQAPEAPKASASRRAVIGEAEALDWLQRKMRSSQGRVFLSSGPKIARELGVATSTLHVWQKRWAEQGKIVIERKGRLTAFSFPQVRRVA